MVNIIAFDRVDKRAKEALQVHNRRVIFVSDANINIKEECYKSKTFFKLHNTGDNPCEDTRDYDYRAYHNKDDLYMGK